MNKPHKNALEWSVFFVSAIIVLATIGSLAWSAISDVDSPPDLSIVAGKALPGQQGTHRVPLLVRNLGNTTAQSVQVEVILRRGAEEVERGELTLSFVPRHSEREGWVTFRNDPRCCEIQARAVSYESP